MPVKLNPGDRKILLAAAAVFLVLVAAAVIFTAPGDTENRVPTTYSVGSEGAKAAYLLLKESGYQVERWEKSPTQLPNGKQKVLILAEPSGFANENERKALENFLQSGGRVIAIGSLASFFLPHGSASFDEVEGGIAWQKFDALAPSAITRAAPQITLTPRARWARESVALALYGDDNRAVVVHYPFGEGEVFWWASATPLSNAGIRGPGNLGFFLASIGDKQSTQVLWDEYFHGYGRTYERAKGHPMLKGLFAQFAILGLATLWTFSRRSGPLRSSPEPSRLSPLEFVETLGGLYQQAHAASVAVDVYDQRFRYWVTRRLGLSNNATPQELERSVRERWKLDDNQFASVLQASASARYQPDLPPKQALKLVQTLHSYATKLQLFPTGAKEKR